MWWSGRVEVVVKEMEEVKVWGWMELGIVLLIEVEVEEERVWWNGLTGML